MQDMSDMILRIPRTILGIKSNLSFKKWPQNVALRVSVYFAPLENGAGI